MLNVRQKPAQLICGCSACQAYGGVDNLHGRPATAMMAPRRALIRHPNR